MRHKKHDPFEQEIGELNLVPYMDIMVNLIMFMLVSMTTFIQMKIINVSVPAIEQDVGKQDEQKDDQEQLAVVLGIVDQRGFVISVNGNFLEGTPENEPTVGNVNGKYDFTGLTKKMEIVKAKQPSLTVLTIVPDKGVAYDTLVKTMDAIRRDSQGRILFPDVLLGVQ